MLYVGVDLGTSSVKLLLMDEAGEIKSIVTREYPLYFPKPGWSEQNPEDWYTALVDGMKELTKDCDKAQIEGISFSGQMHGMVILDENDKVIRPAILWNDGRTQAECDYLNNEIGREKISSYTANMALTGFTAPKLLWVRKHEPENFTKIKKVMLPKDYIAYKLSGIHCTDVSDASGMLLLDVKNKRWSKDPRVLSGSR
jgi:xylulokinase